MMQSRWPPAKTDVAWANVLRLADKLDLGMVCQLVAQRREAVAVAN